eukprot:GCRY01000909.1.p1 GENE.GCRY01000909.1~~GCRY01000909.1.p1  ORF type:complete len:259 (+),score=3.54 GCRY01000909.1:133-909(+)
MSRPVKCGLAPTTYEEQPAWAFAEKGKTQYQTGQYWADGRSQGTNTTQKCSVPGTSSAFCSNCGEMPNLCRCPRNAGGGPVNRARPVAPPRGSAPVAPPRGNAPAPAPRASPAARSAAPQVNFCSQCGERIQMCRCGVNVSKPAPAPARAPTYSRPAPAPAPAPARSSPAATWQRPAPAASKLGGGNKCNVCNKTVYATEEVKSNNRIFHKACFKCTGCRAALTLGKELDHEGRLYCKSCYDKNFRPSGYGKVVNSYR